MRTTRTILIIALLAAVSFIPLAQASWMHRGTQEPDTYYDVQGGMMFLDPDTDPDPNVRQVYFNGQRIVLFTSYNPNLAATGSRMMTPGETSFTALLGFWKDCDGDGYIGKSEYGLQEYRAELLDANSICAAQAPGSCSGGCPSGYIYPHNDGVWVRELIWIGDRGNAAKGGPLTQNPTYFAAPGTKLWGHFGVPGDSPPTTCPITGGYSTRSTGYMIRWGDCFLSHRGTTALNQAEEDTGAPVGGWEQGDIAQSDNTLNIENPLHGVLYGSDGNGHPSEGNSGGLLARDNHADNRPAERAFTTFDCSGETGITVSDPTGGALSGKVGVHEDDVPDAAGDVPDAAKNSQGYVGTTVSIFGDDGTRTFPAPAVGLGNPTGSYYEPVNETYNVATMGQCYPYSHEVPYPIAEGTRSGINAIEGRKQADLNFIFSAGARRSDAADVLGRNWPADMGLAPNRDLDTVGSSWRDNTAYLTSPQVINRQTLEPSAASYVSFYAFMGENVFSSNLRLPGGSAAFTFGEEACPDGIAVGMPNQNGWVCDPDVWQEECVGGVTGPCVLVGQLYHLRDIDCEDGAVSRDHDRIDGTGVAELDGTGVYASGVLVSQKGCLGPNN